MVLQAGVGRRVFADNPTYAQEALASIETAGRASLDELNRLLRVLQPEGGGTAEPFAPTVADLEEMAERIRATGRPVELRTNGVELPAGAARAVYRIVQEALTNAVRHTPSGRIRVELLRNDSQVLLEVLNECDPAGRPGPGARAGEHARAGATGGRRAGGGPGRRRVPGARGAARGRGGGPVIRVLLADDDVLVRSGLRALLDAEEDITVVGEAADGREAVERARALQPDVVLMDVRMPRLDGVAATREIVSWPRRPRVLVLTTFDLDEVVDDALDAGADGFLLKRATPEQLIDGIRTVVAGDALVAPAVTRRLLAAYAARRAPDRDRLRLAAHLTEREADILRALADGLSNAEIAREVWLSPETVKTHVKSVLAKLGVRDRTQAVVWAYRTGFVDPSARDRPAPR